jgi:glycerol-3-phosphate dehydrogenase
MERDADALAEDPFDLLVVGGGINGTGVARDAARRGLRVGLVEKDDFCYGTTSRSTRLVHGGIRYLELLDFGLVRDSLRERGLLLDNAPHLVRPLEFLVPIYEGVTPGKLKMRSGLVLYDLFSLGKDLPSHGFVAPDEALDREPTLREEGLQGAAVYADAQVPYVERLCLENVQDALAHGATIVNHAEVVDLLEEDGEVVGATVEDRLEGETMDVAARHVVNATGPWLDGVTDLAREDLPDRLRTTKGIHLVVPEVTDGATVLFATDGRLFFAVPWNGYTLVGTTDTDYEGDMDEVHATGEDIEYLRESFARFFPDVDLDTIHYTWAGVRSLLKVEGVDESDVSRRHLVLDHGHVEDLPGLVSIVGGKITTHREVAEEVVDLVSDKMNIGSHSDTRDAPLPGAPGVPMDEYLDEAVPRLADRWDLDETVTEHLVRLHGRGAAAVLERARGDPALLEPVCPHAPDIWAQVAHAVDAEMARSSADVLLRRTTVAQARCRGLDAAEEVSLHLAKRLGWDEATQQADLEAFRDEVAHRNPIPDVDEPVLPEHVDA